jgi:peptide/nickel transport system permease protein
MGYSRWRILRRHVLPGVRGPVVAYAVSDLTLVILTVASLSFVGVGIQAPHAEWGAVIYEGRAYLSTAWWISVAPGIVLALTGVAFAAIADVIDGSDSGRTR